MRSVNRYIPLAGALRSRDIPVTGEPRPAARPGPEDTTWMPQPCRSSDMAGTSTPYDLARAVPE